MLKLSAEQLAALGAKNHEEAAAKLVAAVVAQPDVAQLTQSVNGFKAELKAATETITNLQSKLSTAETSLSAATNKIAALESVTSADKLKAVAREEATNVLGAAGAPIQNAVPPNPTTPQQPQKTEADALIAQGKFEEAFAALPSDHKDRKDFSSAGNYAAFMRASGAGRVAIYQEKK